MAKTSRARAKGAGQVQSAWILPDQLWPGHPALASAEAAAGSCENVRVVLVESRAWMRRLPYHRKRQVLILSAGRHFADELRGLGYSVDVIAADDTLAGLRRHASEHRPAAIHAMESTEHAIRSRQRGDMGDRIGCPLHVHPGTLFLVDRFNPIPEPEPGRRYVMENFYRAMRKHFRVLLEPDGTPAGGAWNFDAKNRKPWPKGKTPPDLPSFPPDAITREVMAEVEASGHGVGSSEGFDLPVTREDVWTAFQDFLRVRLRDFGPYEDAMSDRHGVLHHSLMSPAMNLGLIDPLEMVREAERAYREGQAPIESVEGFVRQIVGWREFILWQYRRQMPGLRTANAWDATRPLPGFLWDGKTSLRCVSRVVERLIETGFTHHIERLMIICNFCLLAGVDPAAVADWFLTFYIDSHDWVVLPNVIGMGLNADGGITATKPYVASASYISKMSDFCKSCSHEPTLRHGEGACPFNALYWNFLIEHESELRANPRLGPAVLGLSRLDAAERSAVQSSARAFLDDIEPYGAFGEEGEA